MSRQRTLYLSELITRNKYNEDIYVIKYNDNAVKYYCRDDVIKNLSNTELWNKQVLKWFVAKHIIIVEVY